MSRIRGSVLYFARLNAAVFVSSNRPHEEAATLGGGPRSSSNDVRAVRDVVPDTLTMRERSSIQSARVMLIIASAPAWLAMIVAVPLPFLRFIMSGAPSPLAAAANRSWLRLRGSFSLPVCGRGGVGFPHEATLVLASVDH